MKCEKNKSNKISLINIDKKEIKLWLTTILLVFLMIMSIIIKEKYTKDKTPFKSYESLKVFNSKNQLLKEYDKSVDICQLPATLKGSGL